MIGPNGAGKSSVFNLIAGTIAPDGGTIRFEGQESSRLAAHLRARLGIVRAFQIPQPFPHLTVFENVLAAASFGGGLSGAGPGRGPSCAGGHRPGGEGPVLAGQLPLLDRKRLELAKAMASHAKLLLLDEIAAGLTEREVEELVALIATLKTTHAIIWIEHIPHALRAVADRIMVLHFGRTCWWGRRPRSWPAGSSARSTWGSAPMTLLEVDALDAFYGDFQALFDLTINVEAGETVALIGANGAGKTTFLKCLVGLIETKRGEIRFAGEPIGREPAERISRLGLSLVPEGRLLFPSLSVEENLTMGALNRRPGSWTLPACTICFRSSASGAGRCRTRCRAVSSTWWPSAVR